MNREIKFRGKRIDNEKWVYGYFVKDNDGYWIIPQDQHLADLKYLYTQNENHALLFEVDPETVGQYIGFKDKKEKEIYEKDIVKIIGINDEKYKEEDIQIGQIFFDESRGSYLIGNKYMNQQLGYGRIYEVIGNICENQDLLKQKDET